MVRVSVRAYHGRLITVGDGDRFLSAVTVHELPGHSPGHLVYEISRGDRRLSWLGRHLSSPDRVGGPPARLRLRPRPRNGGRVSAPAVRVAGRRGCRDSLTTFRSRGSDRSAAQRGRATPGPTPDADRPGATPSAPVMAVSRSSLIRPRRGCRAVLPRLSSIRQTWWDRGQGSCEGQGGRHGSRSGCKSETGGESVGRIGLSRPQRTSHDGVTRDLLCGDLEP
jgi:hypothetical protein